MTVVTITKVTVEPGAPEGAPGDCVTVHLSDGTMLGGIQAMTLNRVPGSYGNEHVSLVVEIKPGGAAPKVN